MLDDVIRRWSHAMQVERFLMVVEERANELPENDQREVLERLALARILLGDQYPLAFLRAWKTPEERYTRQYPAVLDHGGAVSPSQ